MKGDLVSDQPQQQRHLNREIQHNLKEEENLILKAVKDTQHEVSFTGYKHVKNLKYCMIKKVSSSVNLRLLSNWTELPSPPGETEGEEESNNILLAENFSFSIIRDPLARLYSGYQNKCKYQIPREHFQCNGFPRARQNPPSFERFLKMQYKDKFRNLFGNPHFTPMSRTCQNMTSNYDLILNLESPTITLELSRLWKALGVSHNYVNKEFPETGKCIIYWYHDNSGKTTQQHYDCSTLRLAIPILQEDYEGPNADYFPFPKWATQMLENCTSSSTTK